MGTRAVIIIVSVFLLKFMISCGCTEDYLYEITYLNSTSSIEKLNCEEVTDEDLYKGYTCDVGNETVFNPLEEQFLRIVVDVETSIVDVSDDLVFGNLGMNKVCATTCNEERIYTDEAAGIKFYAVDLKSNDIIDVTRDVRHIDGYRNEPEKIDSMNNSDFHVRSLSFSMIDFDEVPDSTYFRTELTLESGKIIISETPNVVFRDSTDLVF